MKYKVGFKFNARDYGSGHDMACKVVYTYAKTLTYVVEYTSSTESDLRIWTETGIERELASVTQPPPDNIKYVTTGCNCLWSTGHAPACKSWSTWV